MKPFYMLLLVFSFLAYAMLFANSTVVGYVPDLITVKLDQSALSEVDKRGLERGEFGIPAIDALNIKYNAVRIERHFTYFKRTEHRGRKNTLDAWYKIHFAGLNDPESAVAEYRGLSDIIAASQISICRIYATPNDPDYASQWHHFQSNDHDIDSPDAWDLNTGSEDIIVAIMDSGIRWWHKDIGGANATDDIQARTARGNLWINEAELPDTSKLVDEDGNGYADDWVGWDFVTGNPQYETTFDGEDYDVEDRDPRDFFGHGTHVSGIVSAITNNGVGASGVVGGWGETDGRGNGVKTMNLRIGWTDTWLTIFEVGYVRMDFAANAFTYAADNGAHAANCSWGSSDDPALIDAVNYFLYGSTDPQPDDPQLRIITKAAGNDGAELGSGDYLVNREDVMTTAATEQNDNAASFSDYGVQVDISAPGEQIYSTHHDHNNPGPDDYATFDGTSFSAPMAAAGAAMVWSKNPYLSADSVEQILFNSADDIEDILDAAHKGKMGAGRLNVYQALLQTPLPQFANNDTTATDEDVEINIDVLANDDNFSDGNLTITDPGQPHHGSSTVNGTLIKYSPDENFFGDDSFSYVAEDGNGFTDTAMVFITVKSINDAPVISGLPDDVFLEPLETDTLDMSLYESDVDTPDSLLVWTFEVSDPLAISYEYDAGTDTLLINSLGITGTYQLFCTLTDDSGAYDQDTINVHVDEPSALADADNRLPKQFELSQNFPNPFNPVTHIRYALPKASRVTIELFSINGQKVKVLKDMQQSAGYYTLTVNASDLASGVYIYRMRAGYFSALKKFILVK